MMLFFRGLGRKLAVPFLVFSALGWLLFMIAFAVFNHTDNFFNDYRQNGVNYNGSDGPIFRQDSTIPALRASLLWFPHWCILIVGPFLYIASIIHLVIGRFFTGVFSKFLSALYLATGGAVLFDSGVLLFGNAPRSMEVLFQLGNNDNWLTSSYWGLWPLIEFIGALITILFFTLFVMMWPFFGEKYEEFYEEVEEEVEELVEEKLEQDEEV